MIALPVTHRSKVLEYQRCPRARWWNYEAPSGPDSQGWDQARAAVPLAVGGAVHAGLEEVLRGESVATAVAATIAEYEARCAGRGLILAELENESEMFREQRALAEGLVRLAAQRVVPKLLDTYEVLEVERQDRVELSQGLFWRSIPDAVLRDRETNAIYVLSWKTCALYGVLTEESSRVDMQGLSEPWALTQRPEFTSGVRGVQMAYLVKGARRKDKTPNAAGTYAYRVDSPLVYGWWNNDPLAPEYATSFHWTCSEPHPMRKSQWYPTGECPGDGRRHERRGNWTQFPVWEQMGVEAWMRRPEVQAALDSLWVLPVPQYRTHAAEESWLRQTRSQETRVTDAADLCRQFSGDALTVALDEFFPQHTEKCGDWFGRNCPAWEICHGTAQDPGTSGLYVPRVPFREAEESHD